MAWIGSKGSERFGAFRCVMSESVSLRSVSAVVDCSVKLGAVESWIVWAMFGKAVVDWMCMVRFVLVLCCLVVLGTFRQLRGGKSR